MSALLDALVAHVLGDLDALTNSKSRAATRELKLDALDTIERHVQTCRTRLTHQKTEEQDNG